MKKTQGRAIQKKPAKTLKKVSGGTKKVISKAKTKVKPKVKPKSKTQNLLTNAKKKLKTLTKTSSKNIRQATNKLYATEQEIMHYVKENPVKSISAVALTALIAGFIATRNNK